MGKGVLTQLSTVFFHYLWFKSRWMYRLFVPIAWLYGKMLPYSLPYYQSYDQEKLRKKKALDKSMFKSPSQKRTPVVVVGNLTVGGVGKTPLLMRLIQALLQEHLTVGVISRGYQAAKTESAPFPRLVDVKQPVMFYGDEPVMIARDCGVPVMIDPDRHQALKALLTLYPEMDLVLSDDGLQHGNLSRNFEIVVIDARGWGNGHLLPAGPLREPVTRLQSVDHLVVNSSSEALPPGVPDDLPVTHMRLQLSKAKVLASGQYVDNWQAVLKNFDIVYAMTGIGHPERFFASLEKHNIVFNKQPLPDHYAFRVEDFSSYRQQDLVLVTEKDAVKIKDFIDHDSIECQIWSVQLSVDLRPERPLIDALLNLVNEPMDCKQNESRL